MASTKNITDVDSAARILAGIIAECKQKNWPYGAVNACLQLGNLYANTGNFDSALYNFRLGLTLADTVSKAKRFISVFYNNIAGICQFRGNSDDAVKYYQLAITAAEHYTSNLAIAQIYNNIAVALNQNDQYPQALYYLDKAEESARSGKQLMLLGSIFVNKGIVHGSRKNWRDARNSFLAALDIGVKNDFPDIVQTANTNVGNVYIQQDRPDLAIPYLTKATEVKGCTNPYYVNAAVTSLGKAYYSLGNYKLAETYLLKSLLTAQQHGIGRDLVEAHRMLAKVYEATGQYKLALDNQRKYQAINDSQTNREKQKIINEFDIKYKSAQKDKDITQKQLLIRDQERNLEMKNIWIGIIACGIIILIIIIFGLRRNYRHKQGLQQKQIQIMLQQQEISELKAIMNGEEKERTRIARELHDGIMVQFAAVRMNLNTYVNKPAAEKIDPALQQILGQLDTAAGELRRTAHNLMPDMLLEEGLVEAVYYFCNNLQQTVSFKISFQHYGSFPALDADFSLSVYRIIQELVQNIIKHASAKNAIIQLSCADYLLTITVEDDGIGIADHVLQGSRGMGMKSIRARVHALNGNMELESFPDTGTSVHLEFNVRNRIIQNKQVV